METGPGDLNPKACSNAGSIKSGSQPSGWCTGCTIRAVPQLPLIYRSGAGLKSIRDQCTTFPIFWGGESGGQHEKVACDRTRYTVICGASGPQNRTARCCQYFHLAGGRVTPAFYFAPLGVTRPGTGLGDSLPDFPKHPAICKLFRGDRTTCSQRWGVGRYDTSSTELSVVRALENSGITLLETRSSPR